MTATFPADGGLPFAEDAPAGAVPVADGQGGVQWGSMPGLERAALLALLEDALFRPGDLKPTASGQAQAGFLLCDASSYLRSEFPALFAALGGAASPYGLPDADHFNVPDFRGRSPVGAGTGAGGGASGTGKPTGGSALTARARGDWFGEEKHALAKSEVPRHTHGPGDFYVTPNSQWYPGNLIYNYYQTYGAYNGLYATDRWYAGSSTYTVSGTSEDGTASGLGSGSPEHNTIHPVTVCNWLIRT